MTSNALKTLNVIVTLNALMILENVFLIVALDFRHETMNQRKGNSCLLEPLLNGEVCCGLGNKSTCHREAHIEETHCTWY